MLSKKNSQTSVLWAVVCAAAALAAPFSGGLYAEDKHGDNHGVNGTPLFLTATNGPTNYLAVVDARTREVSMVPTGGAGGASGNAGSVAVQDELAAVANFGSSNVTIFIRRGNNMHAAQVIKTSSKPVSVAFGHDHLVVLGQTTAESFLVTRNNVSGTSDGIVQLLKGDGSAAQIVSFDGGVAYSEKSGAIGIIHFGVAGLIGPSVSVAIPPATSTTHSPTGRK